MLELAITGMAGALIEHSTVITNFVSTIYPQLRNSMCRVYSDNVQYKWLVDGKDKIVVPDASINCQFRDKHGNSFLNCPKFVMEVLSESSKVYDRGEKFQLYEMQEVLEYWIVDWKSKYVECYVLDYDAGKPHYYLERTVTESNLSELQIHVLPHIHIAFDELFYEV